MLFLDSHHHTGELPQRDTTIAAMPEPLPEAAVDVEALVDAASALGEALDDAQLELFERYAARIAAWNRSANLTRLSSARDMALGHFADSLACLAHVGQRLGAPGFRVRCVDVGAGAGLPGLALKIARPAWQVTLVEATVKKADFLAEVVAALALDGVTVVAERAETIGHAVAHREAYDLGVARAVAPMAVLAEYALPLVAVGGRLLCLKGREAADEVGTAGPAIDKLGGALAGVWPYRVPGLPGRRHVVAVDKVGATPAALPRRPGMPAKRPLGR